MNKGIMQHRVSKSGCLGVHYLDDLAVHVSKALSLARLDNKDRGVKTISVSVWKDVSITIVLYAWGDKNNSSLYVVEVKGTKKGKIDIPLPRETVA